MAARTPAGTSHDASRGRATLTLADLPGSVITHALGFLDFEERQRIARVSRRFAALCGSPELLREADVGLENLAAIDSAAAWLVRHGRHVQKLRLGEAWWSVEDRACASALATCLSMAGLAPQLADLTVDVYCEVHTEWLRTMCLLRRLNLTADSAPMHIAPSITALTALQSLELRSTRIQLPPGLPASITRLGVETDCSEEMPVQFAQLPQLQRLKLFACDYSAHSLSRFSALSGSLTRLDVQHFGLPTPSLAALTRLQHLRYCPDDLGIAAAAIAYALPHLTGLTCLVMDHVPCLPPAALSGLSRLQLCCFDSIASSGTADQAAVLPSGPWLRSLRWLTADFDALLSSVEALHGATALERISIVGWPADPVDWFSASAGAFFKWLAHHPPLRQLHIEGAFSSEPILSGKFVVQFAQLWRHRPSLIVHCSFTDTAFDRHLDACHPF